MFTFENMLVEYARLRHPEVRFRPRLLCGISNGISVKPVSGLGGWVYTRSRCTLCSVSRRFMAADGAASVNTLSTRETEPRRTTALRPNLLESTARNTWRALLIIAWETRTSW